MTFTESIRQAAQQRVQRATVRQLAADAGVPKSTFHDFVKGAGVRSTTLDLLYVWSGQNSASAEAVSA